MKDHATPGVAPRLLNLLDSPWAIVPEKLLEMREIYRVHLRGEKIDLEALRAQLGKPLQSRPQNYAVVDGVAVLPVEGIIAKRMNLFTEISGGVSTQLLERDIRQALTDPNAHSLLLHIDSPGGEVDGTQVLSDLIFESRELKPIWALFDSAGNSAAYWIGSAAEKTLIADQTTAVGSIGVIATHVDRSKQDDMLGLKVTEITAGRYKRIASEHEPLDEAGRSYIQEQVDHVYSVFVDSVARNRGVSVETVLQDMADGRVFLGEQAIEAGLVDGVATLTEAIAQLNGKPARSASGPVRPRAAAGAVASGTRSTSPTFEVIEVRAGEAVQTDEGGTMSEKATTAVTAITPDEHEAAKLSEYNRGLAAGAEAERQRIQAVFGKSMPAHEDLVKVLMFDGKTTGAEAAEKILAAEQEKLAAVRNRVKKEAPEPVKATVTADGSGQAASQEHELSHLPVEKRCELEWDKKPELRQEFSSLKAYIAAEKALASGDARIFGRKVQ